MDPLTPRQAAVLAAIRDHWKAHGRSPTVREIADAIGIRHPNGVVCHLKALARKGEVEWARGTRSRAIWPAGLRAGIERLLEGTA